MMTRIPTEMEIRVAKALIDRIGSPWTWEEMDGVIKRLWISHARAAIRAMREPTAEMLACLVYPESWPTDWDRGKALQLKLGLSVVPPRTQDEETAGQYLRMIDAASPSDEGE